MSSCRPPVVRLTRALPFDQLPWDDFERLCLMLLPREGFENPQHYGAAGGEQGRDIVAHRDGDLWYAQCKQVKRCGPKVLLNEIEQVQGLTEDDPGLRPAGMLFMVSCDVSATARDCAARRCTELGLTCEVWGRTDLDARVQPHHDIVRAFFGWYIRPIGVPFQAPPLPAHFVPRSEVSDVLKARLLADEAAAPGVLIVSAIHGLGGIGKTTLVAELAHNPEVQECFPDGTLWTTLGQQPDVLSLLAGWIQALGDYDFHPTLAKSASAHLRTLLHDKACLLVVDDAWQADHTRAFLVGGERCRVLVTTRDATLARKVGVRKDDLYDLDVMTEPQALALFEARLGPLNGDREQAAALAHKLDRLPLALELAAAQVESGASWVELLDTFRQRLADLAALDLDEATYRNESLRLSFRLSLDPLSPDDREAFVRLGVLPEDARLNPAMAATLWDQLEADARKRLRRLRDKSLLKPTSDGQYTVHDLLHDEAKLRLAEQMPLEEAHAALLTRYRDKITDEQWHTLPDDGYIHELLTWHMEQASQVEAIHALLRLETQKGRNAWYVARKAMGQTAGYVDDVRRAWRLAEGEVTTHTSQLAIGLQCRYALITASLNSLIKDVPPALMTALVESEAWTPAEGLAYARKVSHPGRRLEALAKLVPCLPESLKGQALREVLTAAQEVVEHSEWLYELNGEKGFDYWTCLTALAELGPHLPGPLMQEVLALARQLKQPWERSLLFVKLVPYVPEPLRESALHEAWMAVQEANEFGDCWDYIEELIEQQASYFSEQLFEEALKEVWTIPDWEYRTDLLAKMASCLAEPRMSKILALILNEEDEWALFGISRALASHIPEPLLREMLTAARGMQDLELRELTLANIVPRLAELGYPEEALTAARGIEDREIQWEVLVGLAPNLPVPLQEKVLEEALVTAYETSDRASRSIMLAQLAPHLSEPLRRGAMQEALVAARAIGNAGSRRLVLTALVPYLPEAEHAEALREALVAAQEIQDEKERAEALIALTQCLPERLLGEALVAAQEIQDEKVRAEALIALTRCLPERLLGEALVAAQEIGRPEQARVLWALSLRLAQSGNSEEALAIVQEFEESVRLGTVVELASYLPIPLRKGVLLRMVHVCEIGDTHDQHVALTGLAPHLPESLIEEALSEAKEIERNSYREVRGLLLTRLILRLAELGHPTKALGVAREIRMTNYRAFALTQVIPYLPESLRGGVLREALTATDEMWDGMWESWNLAKMLPEFLSGLAELGCAREALEVWMVYGNYLTVERFPALARLAPYLTESQLEEALVRVRLFSDKVERARSLAELAAHLPEPLGKEIQREAITAIYSELESVREIEYREHRLVGLACLASYLPKQELEDLIQELFAALRERLQLEWEYYWESDWTMEIASYLTEASAELIPLLSETLLVELAAEACKIGREWFRSHMLIGMLKMLAPRLAELPCATLYLFWCKALVNLATRDRGDLLWDIGALAPVIHKLGGEEAIAETFRAIQNVGRWWP